MKIIDPTPIIQFEATQLDPKFPPDRETMLMAELFKFRCPECEKLLGVSPKKAGQPVDCPRCGAELIVPSPVEEAPLDPTSELDPIGELGIDLGLSDTVGLRPPERSASKSTDRPVDEVEAIAFLKRTTWLEDPEPSSLEPIDEARDESEEPDPEPLVQAPPEPLVPRSGRSRTTESLVDRRRDVVLPRTAVVAWSMFALLALALSFVAGLMVGHYRWK